METVKIEDVINDLVKHYGNQEKAAEALGVTPRTFRNYVRAPDSVPRPVRLGLHHLLGKDCPPPTAETSGEARPS